MESGKGAVKYQRLFTSTQENKLITENKNDNQDEEKEESKDLPKRKGVLVNRNREDQVALDEIKLANIHDTDREENADEDVDFQGLGLRKYLEK
jgi:uncharacterized protein with gpF-like domain